MSSSDIQETSFNANQQRYFCQEFHVRHITRKFPQFKPFSWLFVLLCVYAIVYFGNTISSTHYTCHVITNKVKNSSSLRGLETSINIFF